MAISTFISRPGVIPFLRRKLTLCSNDIVPLEGHVELGATHQDAGLELEEVSNSQRPTGAIVPTVFKQCNWFSERFELTHHHNKQDEHEVNNIKISNHIHTYFKLMYIFCTSAYQTKETKLNNREKIVESGVTLFKMVIDI